MWSVFGQMIVIMDRQRRCGLLAAMLFVAAALVVPVDGGRVEDPEMRGKFRTDILYLIKPSWSVYIYE